MKDFLHFVFVEHALIGIPTYVVVGVLMGITIRMMLSRHYKVKHKMATRPSHGGCWCETEDIVGDLTIIAMWMAPFIWPVIFPVALIVAGFGFYATVLQASHELAQRGAKGFWTDIKSAGQLRCELQDAKAQCAHLDRVIEFKNKEIATYRDSNSELAAKVKELTASNAAEELSVEEDFKRRTGRELGATDTTDET